MSYLSTLINHVPVTAAGISGPKAEPESEDAAEMKKTLWDNESFEEWSETYNTDVSSVYFTTVAFLPLLQAAGKRTRSMAPSVIVISSMSGIMRHAQGHFSYNAAKGATVHLTKLMSAEFMKVGVRVNSIAPGYFPSEMTAKESGDDQKSELPAEKVQEKGHVPMDRAGADEEMAQAAVRICGQFTTWQILMTLLALPAQEPVRQWRDSGRRRWCAQRCRWPLSAA